MTLYLLPNTLGNKRSELLPSIVRDILPQLQGLIVESERGGRAFLRLCQYPSPQQFPIAVLSKHDVSNKACDFYLEPLLKKQENWGFVSDAGLPCIADPGAKLVRRARTLGIPVQGVSGPCSITLALMLSGLYAQEFSFLGYLPSTPKDREKSIKSHANKKQTCICIETPYRNVHTFDSLLRCLPSQTELCVGVDLTGEQEFVSTRSVETWLRSEDLSDVRQRMVKIPTIFLWGTM